MLLKQFSKERNFRDLGGYKNIYGQTIKTGLYYRSAALDLYSIEELKELEKLHLKTILDLRSKAESDRNPDPIIKDVTYLRHSGLVSDEGKEIDFSPNGMTKLGKEAQQQYNKVFSYYEKIPYDNESLRVFFREIKNKQLHILFHCFTGKDRTGTAAILLLALLEVDKETIMEDYLYSNISFEENINKELAKTGINYNSSPISAELIKMCFGVLPEVGEAIYDGVLKRYQTFDNYFLQEHHLNADDLAEIRAFSLI